jgi:hypothetical protein
MNDADTILRNLDTLRVLIRDDTTHWAPAVRDGCLIAIRNIATWADAQKAPQPRTAPEQPTHGPRLEHRNPAPHAAQPMVPTSPTVTVQIGAPQPRTAEPAGCGYPYCGGNAPECKTCGNKRAAPAPADEPPPQPYIYGRECGPNERVHTEAQMHAERAYWIAKLQAERSQK